MKKLCSLVWNLLLVYLVMSVCRLAFLLTNYNIFADHMTLAYALKLFGAGLIFDTTAIMYGNVLLILLFLFPLHFKENTIYYKVCHWLFTIVNGIFVVANLADITYFPFIGRRATAGFFKEFGGEQGGDFANIFLNGILQYWYLVLLAIALIFCLWKFYKTPSDIPVRNKTSYYISHSIMLPVALVLSVFGMRGGTGVTTRPITMSNANKYVIKSQDTGIVLNTPFCVMRTLGDSTMEEVRYMSDVDALALYNPLHMPEEGAQFKPMNVLVIILESFASQDVGFDNELSEPEYQGYTPFLDSLAQHCLNFRWSYANGRKSIEAQPAVLSSIPNFVESFLLTPAALNDLSGISGELSRNKGYTSTYYHGGNNGTIGLDSFAHSTGFQHYAGRNEYEASKGTGDFDGTWAIWDEPFLQYCCEDISAQGEPFASAIFTATSHHPFKYPASYEGKLPKGNHPMQTVIAYTDNALRKFFDSARRQSWFENTIFVLSADHTTCLTHSDYLNDVGNYCVPIMFYVPSMPSLCGRCTDKIVDQIDIMPTVLGLMGYDKPYVAFGEDILGTAPEDTYAIQYIPSSQTYQYIDSEYAVHWRDGELLGAYRYRTDKALDSNVLDSLDADTREHYLLKIESIVQQYMSRMNSNNVIAR